MLPDRLLRLDIIPDRQTASQGAEMGRIFYRIRNGLALWVGMIGVTVCASGVEPAKDPVADLWQRFEPTHPTVSLDYKVTYHLLSLELKRLAVAHADVTEGVWSNRCSGQVTPACFVDFHLNTEEPTQDVDRVRVALHNRISTILTMPDLEALHYVKRSDERFNLAFKHQKINNQEVFNLESGALVYHRVDWVTGEETNSVPGAEYLQQQSREIQRFMKMIFAFYSGRLKPSETNEDFKLFVYTEATMVPFDVRAETKRRTMEVLDRSIPALCLRAKPGPEAKGKGRNFALYAASFEDVAQQTGSEPLRDLARQSLEWSMVPLVSEFGLFIGTVRCVLTDIHVNPPDAAASPSGGENGSAQGSLPDASKGCVGNSLPQ